MIISSAGAVDHKIGQLNMMRELGKCQVSIQSSVSESEVIKFGYDIRSLPVNKNKGAVQQFEPPLERVSFQNAVATFSAVANLKG